MLPLCHERGQVGLHVVDKICLIREVCPKDVLLRLYLGNISRHRTYIGAVAAGLGTCVLYGDNTVRGYS